MGELAWRKSKEVVLYDIAKEVEALFCDKKPFHPIDL